MNFINNYFKLEEKGTTVKRELIAGLTTFLAMAYILFVNPEILHDANMTNTTAVFTATAIASIIGTLIMGLYANYPVALAPGMGMNAFFTYTIVLQYHFSWQAGLAAIICSGLIFMAISASGLREKIINAIPQDLKYAVGAGIGLFIAFIGFKNANIIGSNPDTLVQLGNLGSPDALLAIIGLIITVILYIKKVPASIFLSIIATGLIGVIWRVIASATGTLTSNMNALLPAWPSKIISLPDFSYVGKAFAGFGQINVSGFSNIMTLILVVFSLLFIDFFDTAGTLVSIGSRAGLIDEKGKLAGSGRALMSDATATVAGAIVGTTSTTSYIESLSGVEVGGRSGLTATFVAAFFMIAIFFSPILSLVTSSVTSPALIFVGILMATQLGRINWKDSVIAITAFLTVLMMPLTYSIATGIAVGFIFYPVSMIAAKRHKEVSVIMYSLAVVFILFFVAKVALS